MNLLLSVTFACGVLIAIAHVVNRRFVAPGYDVALNLTAFSCATTASLLLGHWTPALLSALAVLCWLALARRTTLALRKPRGLASRERSAAPARPASPPPGAWPGPTAG